MSTHLGLAQLSQWEQAAQFDPTNPSQVTRMQYAQIPGGYGSWYYNRVPVTGSLQGLGFPITRQINGLGLAAWDNLSPMAQAGLALVVGVVGGYFGWQKFGSQIKAKVPALAGARRKRKR